VLGYAITFSLACNMLVPIGTAMADRLAYVPSIFPCVLVGALLASVPSRAWRGGLLVIGTGALAVASARQVPQWKDDLALFERQIVTAPRSAKAHGNLGNALREHGRLEEAAAAYDRSIAIFRFRPEAHLGLAQVYELQRRDPELRLATWTDAIRFGTAGNEPWVDQALAWIDLGGWNALEDVLRKQLQVDPGCRFRVHLERILVAARELASVPDPAGGDAWRSGLERLERGDHAGAEATLRTALHRGGVPAAEVPAALEAIARCHAGLGRPGRASSFRRLAAAVRGADASAPAPIPAPTQPGGKRGD
jgi:tetratricopeptide (TPR) repeat protein